MNFRQLRHLRDMTNLQMAEPVSYTHLYVYSFVNDRATNSSDAKEDILEPLQERITGRYLAEDIKDPATGCLLYTSLDIYMPYGIAYMNRIFNILRYAE